MRVSVSLDTLLATVSAPLTLIRRKTTPIDVVFTRSGSIIELGSDAVGHIALTVGGTLVAGGLDYQWTKSGAGTSTVYTFLLSCDTIPVDNLFATQKAPVQAVLSVDWQDGSTDGESSPLSVNIINANLLGTEGTPTEIPDLKATDVQAVDTANTVNWTDPHAVWLMIQSLLGSKIPSLAPQITALVGGGAAHLDGIPTFGGSLTNAITADGTIPLNYTLLIFPTGSPGGEIWRFEASAATANANGVVLPVDHDPVHNANAWILKN